MGDTDRNFNMMENILSEKVSHLQHQEEHWKKRSAPDWMVLSSFRYALGRSTYIVSETVDWLKDNWLFLDLKTRDLIVIEIKEAMDIDRTGMDMDTNEWKKILELNK